MENLEHLMKMPSLREEGLEWTEAEKRWHRRLEMDYPKIHYSRGSEAAVRAQRADWMLHMAWEHGLVPAPGTKKGVARLIWVLMPVRVWSEGMARCYMSRRDYEWAFGLLGGREGLLEEVADGVPVLVRAVDEADARARVEAALAKYSCLPGLPKRA